MSYRPKGKNVRIDPSDPSAVAFCDKTGMVFNRKDLVKQFEWRGNALVWTGFYVGPQFADTPNEQLRPPMLPPDPVPIQQPRNPQPTVVTWSAGFGLPWNQLNQKVFSWSSWGSISDGTPVLPEDQRLSALQNVYFGA